LVNAIGARAELIASIAHFRQMGMRLWLEKAESGLKVF
jgi:hypothetical protein